MDTPTQEPDDIQALEAIGGEPLEGSGFEDEDPEQPETLPAESA
jgi:hypothetical protein